MVRTVTVYTCDICGKKLTNPAKIKQKYRLPIIFHSETTEGKPVGQHVEYETVDICTDCFMKSINIHAVGARGCNEYWFGGDHDV